ncbi:MAG: hypothetical protein DI547_16855 [Sphingobium sp.]|nr:MAG: hypothetical protein DI547_16855 [Sphingobium sp.]
MKHPDQSQFDGARASFGAWLIQQRGRKDALGQFAQAAHADRRFPRNGDPKAVWTYINAQQPDSDVLATLEDAELDWAAL